VTFQRPCLDCGVLTPSGNRCSMHKRAANYRWKEGKPNPYLDPAWKKLSSQIRSKRPWCEVCGKTTDLTVDHLDPISKGGPLLAPEHRLRVCCRACHGRLTKHT
jgi:5-methylcytosine-specific restriction endonuclease McrA